MYSKEAMLLKYEVDNLRIELEKLLNSGEIDIALTLELSMELDLAINNFIKSSGFYYKLS